jgi:hypothetical protein
MRGENGAHKRHMKIPPKGKTSHLSKTSKGEQKPLVDLNDHLAYNINTNMVMGGIGTMLIHLSSFRQFNHGVNEKST